MQLYIFINVYLQDTYLPINVYIYIYVCIYIYKYNTDANVYSMCPVGIYYGGQLY